jgi:hypothetical protein
VIVVTATILFFGPALISVLTGAWLFVAHFGLLMLPAGLVVVASGVVEVSALAPCVRSRREPWLRRWRSRGVSWRPSGS